MIIARTSGSRSSAMNMCSVRQRPIPSAPNSRALTASSGVSAFARTRRRRIASAQPSSVSKLSSICGGTRRHLADDHVAGAAVDREQVALGELLGTEPDPADVRGRSRARRSPDTHGFPIPRATTAAWEVMPPCAVRTPRASMIPWMSSGVVSARTRMTASPARPSSCARSASSTIRPVAAPGEALRPFAATSYSAAGSILGWSSWSSWAGIDAGDRLLLVEQALADHLDRDPQGGGGRALAGAGLQEVERALLDRELDVLHLAVVLLEPRHRLGELVECRGEALLHARDRLRRADPGHDVLALRVDEELAPHARARPVDGSRVKPTPVPESSPLFPKTIWTTFTAVPRSSGISFARR